MSDNPYSSPVVELQPTIPASNPNSLSEIARATFLAWEKLRLIYIGILGIWTLLISGRHIASVEILSLVIVGGLISNVLYFAAPIVDTYVRWLGYTGTWVRILLFVAGTLVTMIFALGALSSALLPNQN
ncbi:MAG: hypothetical protein JNK90_10980 [Planctomycetaceae bacterium]|nr:hypothetical protein [Planctomycetaceae bacterium]